MRSVYHILDATVASCDFNKQSGYYIKIVKRLMKSNRKKPNFLHGLIPDNKANKNM